MRLFKRWKQSEKFPAMRIYLHAMFILLILSLESVFKSLYVKGYQFSFEYEYGPMALLFYFFYLGYVYCTAFIVLSSGRRLHRNLRIPFRLALIVCTFFLFIPLRYLIEQILMYWLIGKSNYPQSVTWSYYFHDNLGISFTVVIAGAFVKFMDNWFVTDRVKSVLERENLRLELDFLKSQLNPHFLFNTLNNVQSYIVQDEKIKSIELIGRLSGIMRFALYECNEEYIGLEKEISILQDYVELERVRCDDRATIVFRADGNFAGYVIPPMLLIPFVENAFKHGPDRLLGNSWIDVAIRQQNGVLDLRVENNFMPLKAGLAGDEASVIRNGGIGLQNVRRRLQYYFNNSHQLTLAAESCIYKVNLILELE
jgi:two-component system LytT family sensor kinase